MHSVLTRSIDCPGPEGYQPIEASTGCRSGREPVEVERATIDGEDRPAALCAVVTLLCFAGSVI